MEGNPCLHKASWRRLDWDANFFGISIGRLELGTDVGRAEVDVIVQDARSAGVVCLYVEVPFGSPSAIALSQIVGIVLTDLKTTLSRSLAQEENLVLETGIRSGVLLKDRQRLEEIVEQIALKSRYCFDPRFGEAAARRLYREWLRRSIDERYADEILVCERDGEAVGFLTMSHSLKQSSISLFGVHASERGRGWGSRLIRSSIFRATAKGSERFSVVTQGHNLEALRIYINSGFSISNINLFYHLWLDKK